MSNSASGGATPRSLPRLQFVGDQVTARYGRIEITVQWAHRDAYTVVTYQGTRRLDEHCAAWNTEDAARTHARGLAVMFRAETAAAA